MNDTNDEYIDAANQCLECVSHHINISTINDENITMALSELHKAMGYILVHLQEQNQEVRDRFYEE